MARVAQMGVCALDGCANPTKRGRTYCCYEHSLVQRRHELPECKAPGCTNKVAEARLKYCCRECYDADSLGPRDYSPEFVAKLREMREQGIPRAKIAQEFGLTTGALSGLLNRGGITFHKQHQYTPEQIEIIKARYPTYELLDSILEAVNACSGDGIMVSAKSIMAVTQRLRIYRPADFQAKTVQRRTGPRLDSNRARKRRTEGHRASLRPSYAWKSAPEAPAPRTDLRYAIKLHELYNIGFQLWYYHEAIRVDQRDDLDAITAACKRLDPTHPGFRVVAKADFATMPMQGMRE